MRLKDDEREQIKKIAERLESSFESKQVKEEKPPLSLKEKLDYDDAVSDAINNEKQEQLNELLDLAKKDERYLRALIKIKLNDGRRTIIESGNTYVFELYSTCLSILTQRHNIEMVKRIIKILKQSTLTEEEQSKYIEKENWGGHTPLIIAVKLNYQDLLEYFVSIGADVYHKTKHKKNALMCASENGYYDITKYLLENHKFNINDQDDEGSTAFMLSVKGGKINTLELLMEHRANPFLVDKKYKTASDMAKLIFSSKTRDLIGDMIMNYIQTWWPEAKLLTEYGIRISKKICKDQITFEKFQEENKLKIPIFDCNTKEINNHIAAA